MSGTRCDNCYKVISGEFINAFNNKYHPDCFVCHHCHRTFPGGKYFTHKDKPYCRDDYDNMCTKCNKVCDGAHIKYDGKKFHDKCFVCSLCRDRLGGKEYHSLEDSNGKLEPFCKNDYELEKRLRASKTGSTSGSASASGSSSTASSRGPSSSSSAASASGKTSASTGSKVCKWCKEGIDGDCLKLGEDRYHNHCFKCSECKLLISKTEDFFDTKDGKGLLCSSCHDYLCVECETVISGEHTNFGGKRYHDRCFKCFKCKCSLDPKGFYELKGRQLCKKDYDACK
eukprot:TRINITY_DN4747_c0_g1_i1.p1 TRINITY_DN4747_c0_g1~~TRINITY_DN4747_c0_g1_i1.p1  ORF type:complete len:303 (-),score=98.96 TRINITY_DN4747_c0_g1_i1:89-943(-)